MATVGRLVYTSLGQAWMSLILHVLYGKFVHPFVCPSVHLKFHAYHSSSSQQPFGGHKGMQCYFWLVRHFQHHENPPKPIMIFAAQRFQLLYWWFLVLGMFINAKCTWLCQSSSSLDSPVFSYIVVATTGHKGDTWCFTWWQNKWIAYNSTSGN